jgi:hypothetical protein
MRFPSRSFFIRGAPDEGNDSETLKALAERRSVRTFKPEQLKEEELQKILEAARFATSARNEQLWHFSVVQNQALLGNALGVDSVWIHRCVTCSNPTPAGPFEFILSNMAGIGMKRPELIIPSSSRKGFFHGTDRF